MFELRYQGETVGWATVDEHGCAMEPANEEFDGPLIQRMAGTLAWFVQYEGFDTKNLNRLFNASVRIGQEAGVPTVIENVRGAIP